MCQPAGVNYLLCLNSAERSKAYGHTAHYDMVGVCKCVCVCEGPARLGHMCQNNGAERKKRQPKTEEKNIFPQMSTKASECLP